MPTAESALQATPPTSAPGGSTLGAVSGFLEAELRTVVKQKGLVFWLDSDEHYSDFAQVLAQRAAEGTFPYPVLRYQGSFLELMLALERYGNDRFPDKVLVHLPGFNEQAIAETPVYELYKAGKRYRKALDTLIQEAAAGKVRPEEIQTFLQQGPLSLEAADTWLRTSASTGHDVFLVALEGRGPLSVVLDLFSRPSKLLGELTAPPGDEADAAAEKQAQFLEYMKRALGVPVDEWSAFLFGRHKVEARDLLLVVGSWLMAVEFVTDLMEEPVTPELKAVRQLQKPLVQACRKAIVVLREKCSEEYAAVAVEFEERLKEERGGHSADKLGSIDTFQFEERSVRQAALAALTANEWDVALNYARDRHPQACFWVAQDNSLERTWRLVTLAAEVGGVLRAERQGLKGCASLEEAVTRYRDKLYRVDQAQRHFEQEYRRVHSTDLEDDIDLHRVRDEIRRRYRVWADQLTGEFAALCETYGPLPSADLRQRRVYDQFVHATIETGERVAFFMIDAMRFEMAVELRDIFEGRKFKTQLHARLAELPTVTEVGMNALAPVSHQDRLRPVFKDRSFAGFRSGENFTVNDPPSRVRSMASRSVGGQAIDMELNQLSEMSADELKKKLRTKNSSNLIVVRSLELDSAGEKGLHLETFEATLVRVREAVQRLQRAGISRFVLASDHGFLLQDIQTTQQVEYKDSPKRRHVLSQQRAGMAEALEVPLSALDYEADEAFLVFRRDTAIWKVKEKIAPFVHGGNSLQERVIPVLCLERKGKAGSSAAKYEVVASALPAEQGRQRLSLTVRLQKQSTGMLSFAGPKRVSLALRVRGRGEAPQVVEVTPPGMLQSGAVLVPPAADPVVVTFVIEGEVDDRVQVELYHPDGTEQVTPTVVEGWFDMSRNRRLGKPKGAGDSAPPPAEVARDAESPPSSRRGAGSWHEFFDDAEFLRVFSLIEVNESVNEQELLTVLQNPRRVRAFARSFDRLNQLVPFDVHITTVGGMKVYVKGEKR